MPSLAGSLCLTCPLIVCSRQSRLQQPLQSPCGPRPLPSAKAAPHFRLSLGQHPTLRTKISPVICLWVTHSPRACTTSCNFWGSGAWGPLSGLAFALRSQSRCHHPGSHHWKAQKGPEDALPRWPTCPLAGRLSFLPWEPLCRASPTAHDPREFAAKTEAMVSL